MDGFVKKLAVFLCGVPGCSKAIVGRLVLSSRAPPLKLTAHQMNSSLTFTP